MHRVRRADVFPPGAGQVVAERYDLAADSGAHSHDFVECAVVTGGTAVHVSAAGERRLGRGSAVLARPGDWHGYRDCRGLTVHNVYVGPELFSYELAWLRADTAFAPVLNAPGGARTFQLGDEGLGFAEYGLSRLAAPVTRAVRLGLLLSLLGTVVAADRHGAGGSGGPRTAPVHPAATGAARLLEDEPAAAWTVARLAAAVGLSEPYFARLFRRQFGVPPMAYLNRVRAERAAALLIETELPVAAIGRRVGWPDPNYAGRRFRAHFAYSPARYRARFRPDGRSAPGEQPG
ncbi:AraC family transcriptional regulator [Streptomyces sp. NPDC051940]|uniref:helix-turn-helix domain-containing protein n=1 Tax=Streptomyces sp. NPDC051940 TaxID=3155675 RepID=UPI0034253880